MKISLRSFITIILVPGVSLALFSFIGTPFSRSLIASGKIIASLDTPAIRTSNPQQTVNTVFRSLPNNSFTVGEKLDYDIVYGPIVAGSATISTPSYETYGGRQCYKVEFTMRSARFFDFFFKVRDNYSSLIDVKGLFPWCFEQHVREGGYKKDFQAWFDQSNHTARSTDGGPYPILPYTQDIVSTFFFARTLNYDTMKIGQEIHFSNFYENKVYPLDVKFLGQEDIETKAGKFHCQIIEPIIVKGGLFKNTGRLILWVTADSLKVPVRVQTQVTIGSAANWYTTADWPVR